jgi:hypothetical protein
MINILLGFIVIMLIAVLFTYYNKNKGSKREKFTVENQYSKQYTSFLKGTFTELLHREPTDYEISLYSTDQNDKPMIVSRIKSTQEFMDRSSSTGVSHIEHFTNSGPTDKTLETYRQIINIYNNSLDRMPSKYELEFYENKINKEGFTSNQLQSVLESSKEYYILQKNQTNIVNGQLPGNITDAQITLDVRGVYQRVYGSGTMPPENLEDFLKIKYTEYNVSKEKLYQFLLLIKSLDNNENVKICPVNDNKNSSGNGTESGSNTGTSGSIGSNGNNGNNGNNSSNGSKGGNGSVSNPMVDSNKNYKDNGVNHFGANDKAVVLEECQSNNKNKCASQVNELNSLYSEFPYDEQYAILLELNNGKTGLPKQCDKYASTYHRDLYAEEVAKRNKNQVQYECDRTKYFQNEIDNGILSTTGNIYATPLYEAANTKVGSILPKFEYKNVC